MITRIKKVIQYKKLSSSAFADQVGVPRSTISHILSGRNNPSLEFIQKVLDTFPELRIEWLVRGEGNMVKSVNTLFSDEDFNDQLSEEFSIESTEKMKDEIHDAFKTHKETVEEITSQESNITPPIKGVDEISKSGEVKKKEGLPGNAPKPAISNNKTEVKSDKSERKTVKVILFFSDGSFSEHYPQ
jgi:transcriptional regulator with XRE-family HTH domain